MKHLKRSGLFNPRIRLLAIVIIAGILRVTFLNTFPPGLYSDEVSQGYNAYAIITTGKDEHGTHLPVTLRAFGEWKPPLSTYMMIPTISLLGLNGWGVRLPSALLGTLTVYLTYFLVKELIKIFVIKHGSQEDLFFTHQETIALLVALLLAISPWHILQSRAALHGSIALFLIATALWSLLKSFDQGRFLFLSSFAFAASMYTYYGLTLVVLSIVATCGWFFRFELKLQRQIVISSLLFGLLLIFPLVRATLRQPNVLFGRAKYVSIFYDQSVSLKVWSLITQDGSGMPPRLAQILHNKPYHYLSELGRRLFQHLDGSYLFLAGDKHPPFQIPGMGVMYLMDISAFVIGMTVLIKQNSRLLYFLLWWGIITILPAALTFLTPSANRSFLAVLPFAVVAGIGAASMTTYLLRKVFKWILIGVYIISFGYFCFQYFYMLPTYHADWWFSGYPHLMSYLYEQEGKYDHIVISGKTSVPYIFLLFYQTIDPRNAQKYLVRNYMNDNFGFEHVDAFHNYIFPRNFSWEEYEDSLKSPSLVVVTSDEKVGETAKLDRIILYPDGRIAYKIFKI